MQVGQNGCCLLLCCRSTLLKLVQLVHTACWTGSSSVKPPLLRLGWTCSSPRQLTPLLCWRHLQVDVRWCPSWSLPHTPAAHAPHVTRRAIPFSPLQVDVVVMSQLVRVRHDAAQCSPAALVAALNGVMLDASLTAPRQQASVSRAIKWLDRHAWELQLLAGLSACPSCWR